VSLRGSKEVAEKELGQVLKSVTTETKLGWKEYLLQCLEPQVWKPFLILLVFFVCQEGSGIYIVLYYATNFFQVPYI
jgi:SP family facilitated glucose transporter-like MFS transporter 8